METKMPISKKKFIWSKHPEMEKATLELILLKYKAQVNGKPVSASVWDSIAADLGYSEITGPSIKAYFRNMKKSYLDPSTDKVSNYDSLLQSILENPLQPAKTVIIPKAKTEDQLVENHANWLNFDTERSVCSLCLFKLDQLVTSKRSEHLSTCLNALLSSSPLDEGNLESIIPIRDHLLKLTKCPYCKISWNTDFDGTFKLNHLQVCAQPYKFTIETIFDQLRTMDFSGKRKQALSFHLPETPVLLRRDGSVANKLNALEMIKVPKKHYQTRILEPAEASAFLDCRTARIMEKTKFTDAGNEVGFTKSLKRAKIDLFSEQEGKDLEIDEKSLWEVSGNGIPCPTSAIPKIPAVSAFESVQPIIEAAKRKAQMASKVFKIADIPTAGDYNLVIPPTPRPVVEDRKLNMCDESNARDHNMYEMSPTMLQTPSNHRHGSPLASNRNALKKTIPKSKLGATTFFMDSLRIETPEKSLTPREEFTDGMKLPEILKPARTANDIYVDFQNEIHARRKEVDAEMAKLTKVYQDWAHSQETSCLKQIKTVEKLSITPANFKAIRCASGNFPKKVTLLTSNIPPKGHNTPLKANSSNSTGNDTPMSADIYDYCPTQKLEPKFSDDIWQSPVLPAKISLAYDCDSQFPHSLTAEKSILEISRASTVDIEPVCTKPSLSVSSPVHIEISPTAPHLIKSAPLFFELSPKKVKLTMSTATTTRIQSQRNILSLSKTSVFQVLPEPMHNTVEIMQKRGDPLVGPDDTTNIEQSMILPSFFSVADADNNSILASTGLDAAPNPVSCRILGIGVQKDCEFTNIERDEVLNLSSFMSHVPKDFSGLLRDNDQFISVISENESLSSVDDKSLKKLVDQSPKSHGEYSILLGSEHWPEVSEGGNNLDSEKRQYSDFTSDIDICTVSQTGIMSTASMVNEVSFDVLLPSPMKITNLGQSPSQQSKLPRILNESQTRTDLEKTFIINETCSLDSTFQKHSSNVLPLERNTSYGSVSVEDNSMASTPASTMKLPAPAQENGSTSIIPEFSKMSNAELLEISKLNNLQITRKDKLIEKLNSLWASQQLHVSPSFGKDTKILILEFLQKDEDIYKKILRYEPLDFNILIEKVCAHINRKVPRADLKEILDTQCVNYVL